MRNLRLILIVVLVPAFSTLPYFPKPSDKNKIQEALVIWESLEELAVYSNNPPKDLEVIEVDVKSHAQICLVTLDVANNCKFTTAINADLLNIDGGLKKLQPLSFANATRYQSMLKGMGVNPEVLPQSISVEIEIIAALKNMFATDAALKKPIFFQAKITFIAGKSVYTSAIPELWKFEGNNFYWLSPSESWMMGM